MLELAEKWFAPLADRPSADAAPIPQEPAQTRSAPRGGRTRRAGARPSPWPTTWAGAPTPDFYTADLVSDLLAGGDSGRLYTHLVKERRLAVERQRLRHGRRRPGAVRLHGPAASGRDARRGRSGVPRGNRNPANRIRGRTRDRKGQEQVRSQHALRRTERDEQGDEPRILRDAGRPRPDQPRGRTSTAPSATTTSVRSAAARSGPKTAPHSFTTRKNDTTPHNPLGGRGRRGRKDAAAQRHRPLHARFGGVRSAAHLVRLPGRIGSPAGALLGIGGGQSARRRHAQHDGPRDRRTTRLLRLVVRCQHRPRLRLYQFRHPLEILRPDARRGGSRFCSAPCSPKRSCAPTPPNANNGWRSTARKSMSRPAKPSPGRCSGRTTPTASRRTNANTTTSRAKPWPISTGGSTPPRTVLSYAAAASGSTNCRPSGPSPAQLPHGEAETAIRFPAPETTHAAFVEHPGAVQSSLRHGTPAVPAPASRFRGHAGRGDGIGRILRVAADAEPARRARIHLRRGVRDGQFRARGLFRRGGAGRNAASRRRLCRRSARRSNASARSRCPKRNWRW